MRRDLQVDLTDSGRSSNGLTGGGTDLRRALLVGIDTYSEFRTLTGCVNDVRAVNDMLASHDDGSPNFDCQVLAGPGGVSCDQLRTDVGRLFAPGADVALLYFAGHGIHRNNDLVLATTDGTAQSPGVTMAEVMGAIADPTVLREVIIILDCCFSGAAGGVPHLNADVAALRPGLSILTAARADQVATETAEQRGLFSTMLCGALGGGAADVMGKVSISGLYAYLSECFGPWDQRPTLKANIDRVHDLRRCTPAVPLHELRRLPELFPTPEYEMALDPSYETDSGLGHEQHEATLALLRRALSAKLVEPVGTAYMYFAAMESHSCRLTPLGRHYRMLAEQHRI